MPMPENLEFFTFLQLQKRWKACYRTVRKILTKEGIPVIALSINGAATWRIPTHAIFAFEKRRKNLAATNTYAGTIRRS